MRISYRRLLIRERRERLGIGLGEMARETGMSVSECRDIELYEDELTVGVPLKNARALARLLGLELGSLFGVGSLDGAQSRPDRKPRQVVISEARNRIGVSIATMVEDVGFDEAFISSIENEADALEEYPFDVMKIVASYLKVDLGDLLWALPGTAV